MADERQNGQKETYRKPVLVTIDLAAEEVLAVGCKAPSVHGFNNPGNTCRAPKRCLANGS
ncbi:MAG: hypothetical protein JEZ11_04845 [Desulfobacterales bacterium]|nr:hypothetical protein [Desulfobacterales bacterium]